MREGDVMKAVEWAKVAGLFFIGFALIYAGWSIGEAERYKPFQRNMLLDTRTREIMPISYRKYSAILTETKKPDYASMGKLYQKWALIEEDPELKADMEQWAEFYAKKAKKQQ